MLDLELLKDEAGNYPDDIARIVTSADPEKKRVLTSVGTMVVQHSRYHDVWEWLEDVLQESDTGLEATAGLLYGPSGVGKSTVLRLFVKEHGGPFQTADGTVRPVIRVSTPANPTLSNMLKAMARALGAMEALTNDVDDLRSVVLTQLEGQNVKLIIFDEFTHIVEDRSEKFAIRAVRGLKELLSENYCQCVFAGTEELVRVHSLYKQFRRRSAGDLRLFPFDWDDDDDHREWIEMMKSIQSNLPRKCASPLGTSAMAKKMHLATDGIMDHVMKLLFRATSYAYDDGASTISDSCLASAFERLRRGEEKRANPFHGPERAPRKMTIVREEPGADGPEHEETSLRSSGRRRKPEFVR